MTLSAERRAQRRKHLLETAKALIREGGDAGFSMTQLAARAGLSPATPYNLIGGRSEILRLILHEEVEGFAAKLAILRGGSSLTILLNATALVVSHYAADQPFYRGLYRAASVIDSSDMQYMMTDEGRVLFRGLVRAALDSGELAQPLQVGPFTDVLLRVMGSTSGSWLRKGWSVERFDLEMSHAVRLLIAAVAAPSPRERLLAELAFVQTALVNTADPDCQSARETDSV
ncbi:MAG: transcriptional regulator, TetR family [Bradyrhizobium sp.]|nr:transcriptional regulator, TetR family [Bradyrhizobium sp.]